MTSKCNPSLDELDKDDALFQQLAHALEQWYTLNGRDLPWRHTTDPYAIWLSEVVLQQTRVAQGTDYWHRLLRAFPTVSHLAEATEDEVLKQWQGLGYYSRARNLHKAAQQIVERGHFPQTATELQQLKGIGPYTAAAVASIAFNEPVAAVDGNFHRVLSRLFSIQLPIAGTEGRRLLNLLAQHLVQAATSPAALNQAVMDLGATLCTPISPSCSLCPLSNHCLSYADGSPEALPIKAKRTAVRERHLYYIYVRHGGQTVLHRRGAGDIWQGLWEPVCLDSPEELEQWQHRLDAPLIPVCLGVKHVLTHRVLMTDLYLCQPNRQPVLPEGYRWMPEDELQNYAFPRLVERLLVRINENVQLLDSPTK